MPFKNLMVERDAAVPMRDGVVLRADVYRPDVPEPLPVLLQRTPYGKGWSQNAFALLAAERGYAVVIQDTRGRWNSEGDGTPFLHEKADGFDSVAWAAAQPWSAGKVGMFGASYVGYTQLTAAVSHPPALVTIVPTVTFCDAYEVVYNWGVPALGAAVSWGLMAQAQMAIMRYAGEPAEKAALMEQLIEAADGMSSGATFRHLPVAEMPLIGRGGVVPWLSELLAHPIPDEQWASTACPYDALALPMLHIGGWYDIFATQTLRNFAGIRAQGNRQQKLLVGPWLHGPFDGWVGDVDFGLRASETIVVTDEVHLRWFDYWLKGIQNGVMDEPPIRLFVMGENRWRTENEWPLARTQYTSYYLRSEGGANTLHGDGLLSPETPGDEPADTFLYDPRNPAPTRGGGLCCWQPALPAGAYDQREIEARPDVLVYSTPPLEHDLEATGPLAVHLWAATSAPDTDFTAKLVDVGPCGYARNVADGIVRARYRNGLARPELVHPGEAYQYVIELNPTSNLFKAGHRIRVEISSSSFPRWDRNPNTGAPIGEGTELRPALQMVFHDAAHPSRIVLPVIVKT